MQIEIDFNTEIWKPVVGYEGYYEVSCMGRVRSIDRFVNSKNNSKKMCKGMVMRYVVDKHGYIRYVLKNGNKRLCVQAHRVVAVAFVPNLDNKPIVNHINGVRSDNRVENLEWVTIRENVWHSSQFKGNGKKTSKYTGVCRLKNMWCAYLHYEGKTMQLGRFKTEDEAHSCRINAMRDRNIDITRSLTQE